MTQESSTKPSPLYAVIDLGSNSFHMLITRVIANSVQTVDKVKRKVRLAAGLDENNRLNDSAMAKGLECLSFFAERLQDIPPENIRIVATATLRIATNAKVFLTRAEKVLGRKIELLSGEEEAKRIYLGAAHTNCTSDKKLVLDIGGASTEIIVGDGFVSQRVVSLNMGCVTFKNQFFPGGKLSSARFSQAVDAAKQQIKPLTQDYQAYGWHTVLGGSGTMQALAEILSHQKMSVVIDLAFMHKIREQILGFDNIADIDIPGLAQERIPVLASGLAILIALFETLSIKQLELANGALREGILYEMLPNMRQLNIRERTINSLSQRFHIDQYHAARVCNQAENIFNQVANSWHLKKDNAFELLIASCALHEIGLLLEYKHHQQHGAYIIQQADLPGFNAAERNLLAMFILHHKADICSTWAEGQSIIGLNQARYLLAILRIAILLCRRRQDDVLPNYQVQVTDTKIKLSLPASWLSQHPLIEDELRQENLCLQAIDLTLNLYQVD